MKNLLEQVEQEIFSRGLFRRGQKILVAVSGGVDSMVLLHLLHELAVKHKWQLTVAHLNHLLRGRSSDADERLVVRVAKKFRLPIVVERADIKAFATAGKLSLEMAARKVRHDFLARIAARLKIPAIALAHHADDQLELFFLRLLRGSGSEGLAGMRWKSRSPANPKIQLIRPLLSEPKDALHEFAMIRKISFREDASNASLDFQRNRIRHELLPLLRSRYQPALDQTIARVMDIAAAEAAFINRISAEWLGRKGKQPFEKLPVAIQRRCLQLQLVEKQIPFDYELIERLRESAGTVFSLTPALAVFRETNGRVQLRKTELLRPQVRQRAVDLRRSGEENFGGLQIRWQLARSRLLLARKPGQEFFDADKVGARIVLRHWQPGDRFQPIGMKAAVKLQDLFTNLKIPRNRRHALAVATTHNGVLFWVENLRIGEQFKLTDTTVRRLEWRWNRP